VVDAPTWSEPNAQQRPLRIAEVTDNYGPGRNGLLYAVQQIEGTLLDAGHEVIVAAPRCGGPNPYANHPHRTEIRFPSVRVIGVPARVATGLRAERRLQRIEDMRPDVIHVHGLGPLGLLGTLLARRTGIPLVVTWHTDWDAYIEHYSLMTPVMAAAHRVWRLTSTGGDTDTEEAAAGRARYADRGRAASELLGGAAAMIGAATVVTTPSNKTARRVAELYGGRDVRTLPNGVDPLLPTPDRVVPRAPGVRFLYVGRISPEKGIVNLVRAFRIVNRLVPSTELMLVGDWRRDPSTRARLTRERARLKALNLVGEVDRSLLGSYYAAADVFCFPSLTDTQGLVLHEAAHAGLPFISCDPELDLVVKAGVNAELCTASPDAMAGAMLRMVDKVKDEAWRAKAAAASRSLAAEYTVAGQNAKMLDLYREVAAKPRARRT